MSRNGAGVYTLPAGNPVVTGTVIDSTVHNNTMSDLATALTGSVAADGQTPISANQSMSNFRHTSVGNAAARTDYAAAGQVQDSSLQWLTTVAGTNTITAVAVPAITAYAAGQTFRFIPAVTNTGAATLNINSVGAKSLVKNTPAGYTALIAGDLIAANTYEIVYDDTGSDQFVVVNPSAIPPYLQTAVTLTNQTSVSFTSIPSWVKRITVMFSAVSTNGTSLPVVQIGDSGGVETSGYVGATGPNTGGATAWSNNILLNNGNAATHTLYGALVLNLMNASTNTWAASLLIARGDANTYYSGAGTKSLSATLDRVVLTTFAGIDEFDAGIVNISYE